MEKAKELGIPFFLEPPNKEILAHIRERDKKIEKAFVEYVANNPI